jgi:hypothetical protein
MYTYHCHNTERVHVSLLLHMLMSTFRILVFQDISLIGRFLLPTSKTKILWKPQIRHLLLFYFNAIRRKKKVCIYILTMKNDLGIHYKCFPMLLGTFKTILIVQLKFLNFSSGEKFLNYFTHRQATVHVPSLVGAAQFGKHWPTRSHGIK